MYQYIEKLYQDFERLIKFLEEQNQPSLKSDADAHFKKILIISVAGIFEKTISEILKEFIKKESKNPCLHSFVNQKAINRQYHTFFDWKKPNANRFLNLFGEEFKDNPEFKTEEMVKSIRDFMEIGKLRNNLVHENYALESIPNTAKEIYEKYLNAKIFLNKLNEKLNNN